MIGQSNLMALHAHGQMQINSLKLQSSLQKLSSGYRINSAADDAAGLSISERMRGQMTAVERAMANAQDGMSLTQTAEGALTEVHSMLNRLTDLATQASNGTLGSSQRESIQKESNDILKEIDRISKATNFNGIKLLDGSLSGSGNQSVSIKGVSVGNTYATEGEYAYNSLPEMTGLTAGEKISFSMGLNNKSSENFEFTVSDDMKSLVAADGTAYDISSGIAGDGNSVTVGGQNLADALADQLRGTPTGDNFNIDNTGGALKLTNRQAGTSEPQIASFSVKVGESGSNDPIAATVTAPTDTRADIKKESLTVFDGTNQDQATFNVNGQKFALVNEANYAETIAKYDGTDINFIKVEGNSGATLSNKDLGVISADINQKTGLAFQANGSGGIQVRAQNGSGGLSLQVGETADRYNNMNVSIGDMSSRGLGLSGLDFTTVESANRALSRISSAIDKVSSTRGDLGAANNRLEYTVKELGIRHENLTAAESRIRDVDMAKEMINFVRQDILNQASQSMLAQANTQASQVLQLLK